MIPVRLNPDERFAGLEEKKQQFVVTLLCGALVCFLVGGVVILSWNLNTCFLSLSVDSVQHPDP